MLNFMGKQTNQKSASHGQTQVGDLKINFFIN